MVTVSCATLSVERAGLVQFQRDASQYIVHRVGRLLTKTPSTFSSAFWRRSHLGHILRDQPPAGSFASKFDNATSPLTLMFHALSLAAGIGTQHQTIGGSAAIVDDGGGNANIPAIDGIADTIKRIVAQCRW